MMIPADLVPLARAGAYLDLATAGEAISAHAQSRGERSADPFVAPLALLGGLPDEEDAGDGCFERAVRAVRGTRTATPDMGLEWRLLPVGVKVEDRRPSAAPPAPVAPDADLASFLAPLAPQPRAALKRALRAAGVATLDQLDAMTDDELMDMPGVGWTTRTKIRDFLARRTAAQETEKANGEGVA